jgi:hypothetical protein
VHRGHACIWNLNLCSHYGDFAGTGGLEQFLALFTLPDLDAIFELIADAMEKVRLANFLVLVILYGVCEPLHVPGMIRLSSSWSV